MFSSGNNPIPHDDVEQLLLNARLRDELEPYDDDSLSLVALAHMPTRRENEFLQSLLLWERAPILPISQWFEPELALPLPEELDDESLSKLLAETIERLASRRIVLQWTEHLSDRQLYCLILRDILPSPEKRFELPDRWLAWRCLDEESDPDTWLRYYATHEQRREWSRETGREPPPPMTPPFPRRLPAASEYFRRLSN